MTFEQRIRKLLAAGELERLFCMNIKTILLVIYICVYICISVCVCGGGGICECWCTVQCPIKHKTISNSDYIYKMALNMKNA